MGIKIIKFGTNSIEGKEFLFLSNKENFARKEFSISAFSSLRSVDRQSKNKSMGDWEWELEMLYRLTSKGVFYSFFLNFINSTGDVRELAFFRIPICWQLEKKSTKQFIFGI
jgi:hypothetical protein